MKRIPTHAEIRAMEQVVTINNDIATVLEQRGVDIDAMRAVFRLARMAEPLWQTLDDIDTLDDACKDNDLAFRDHTRTRQKRRHAWMTSPDGLVLAFIGPEPLP